MTQQNSTPKKGNNEGKQRNGDKKRLKNDFKKFFKLRQIRKTCNFERN